MLKNEREQEILNLLRDAGYVTVRQLSDTLYTSESSIRRALAGLEGRGLIRRSYGGAELLERHTNVVAFGLRTHHNAAAKRAIAKKAAPLVADGSIVFLDQSSTAYYLAAELSSKSGLTVMTNNLEILNLLARTDFTVRSSGGHLSESNRMCLVGPDAQSSFRGVFADYVFFAASALSARGIISDCNRDEIAVRSAMLEHADRHIFLCDSGKFGTHSAYRQCSLADVDILISEQPEAACFETDFPDLEIL